MKFIFPQNYDFKNKVFGFIDPSTIIINVVWGLLVFFILNLFINALDIKIILIIIFCFPVLLLSFSGLNGENFIYIMFYIFKFIFRQKIFFYGKTSKYR